MPIRRWFCCTPFKQTGICEVEEGCSWIKFLKPRRLTHTRMCLYAAAPQPRMIFLKEILRCADTIVSQGPASRSSHNAAGQEAQHGAECMGRH